MNRTLIAVLLTLVVSPGLAPGAEKGVLALGAKVEKLAGEVRVHRGADPATREATSSSPTSPTTGS